jgi:hypothetical protein
MCCARVKPFVCYSNVHRVIGGISDTTTVTDTFTLRRSYSYRQGVGNTYRHALGYYRHSTDSKRPLCASTTVLALLFGSERIILIRKCHLYTNGVDSEYLEQKYYTFCDRQGVGNTYRHALQLPTQSTDSQRSLYTATPVLAFTLYCRTYYIN